MILHTFGVENCDILRLLIQGVNMKKFLSLFIIYLLISTSVFARDLRFIQITDVRYKEGENQTISKVIKDVNKVKNVEFVVFTGDILDKPQQENLEAFLAHAKKLKKPFYIVIGDKDVNKHKKLGKKEFAKIVKKKVRGYKHNTNNFVFEKGGVVFLAVDGTKDVIPSTNGYYKDNVLEWVDANLDLYAKKNVVILQHFPIIPPENNENYYTFKPENYLKIINEHKNVKAVISGHFGVNKEITQNGVIHISTAPAPNYRIIDIIDCTSDNPTFWAEIKNVNK